MRLALTYYRVDPSQGGAETYVRDLCHGLVRAGHAVDLYAHAWCAEALPAEVRCIRVAASAATRLGRLWRFAENSERALRAGSYDCTVGFVNTWHQDVLIPQGGVHGASLDCNARRFPAGWRRSFYRARKRVNPKAWVYDAVERRQYDLSRPIRVVAVSAFVREHLEQYHHIPRSWIDVIPNAIDADRLRVDDPAAVRQRYRRTLGLADDDLVALFVGHNFWLKGLPPLLHALALRQAQQPGVRPIQLLVCGNGRLDLVRRLVHRLGLDRTVRLIGFAPDIRPCFWASDFFVLPTYYDPCSLVVFEALACGLPVVTTRMNGAGELITPGQEGFVIAAPDDLEGLLGACEQLSDDTARRAMSAAAARLGQAQSFDRHLEKLIAVFQRVAATKGGRTSQPRLCAGPMARTTAPRPNWTDRIV